MRITLSIVNKKKVIKYKKNEKKRKVNSRETINDRETISLKLEGFLALAIYHLSFLLQESQRDKILVSCQGFVDHIFPVPFGKPLEVTRNGMPSRAECIGLTLSFFLVFLNSHYGPMLVITPSGRFVISISSVKTAGASQRHMVPVLTLVTCFLMNPL